LHDGNAEESGYKKQVVDAVKWWLSSYDMLEWLLELDKF
jgi:hypothetical protein